MRKFEFIQIYEINQTNEKILVEKFPNLIKEYKLVQLSNLIKLINLAIGQSDERHKTMKNL